MSQSSEHAAAGCAGECRYCGDSIFEWEPDYIVVYGWEPAHKDCHDEAQKELMALADNWPGMED